MHTRACFFCLLLKAERGSQVIIIVVYVFNSPAFCGDNFAACVCVHFVTLRLFPVFGEVAEISQFVNITIVVMVSELCYSLIGALCDHQWLL